MLSVTLPCMLGCGSESVAAPLGISYSLLSADSLASARSGGRS